MSVFVGLGADGRAKPVDPVPLVTAEDRRLDAHALELIRLRSELEALPV
jgi:4-hydroxybenzoyl-CoA thioesterase